MSQGDIPEDAVVTVLEDEEVRLLAHDCAIRRAQEIVRRYVPEGQSLVDELIKERREHGSAAQASSTPDQFEGP